MPERCIAVDAPIGSRRPRIIRPTIVETLIVVNQNSTSPFLRTLSILKLKGIKKAMAIEMPELTFVFGIQKFIVLAIATSFAAKAIAYLPVN